MANPIGSPRLVLTMAAAALMSGCGGGTEPTNPPPPPPPPAPVVTTVTVTAPRATIVVGESLTLSAVVRDAQGQTMSGKTVAWSSSNATAASVSTLGVVTGLAEGDATITGSVEGKSGSVQLAIRLVLADASRQVSAVVGAAGDTLTTSNGTGISYSLEIPAGAIETPVTISMTPVSGMKGASFSGGLLGAVRFAPAGLSFLRGVRLRITGVTAPPAGQVAVAFVGPDTGGIQALVPSTLDGSTLTVIVPHFSVVGAGAELPARIAGIVPRVDTAIVENNLSLISLMLADGSSRAEFNDVLDDWGAWLEFALIASRGSTVEMLDALAEYALWTGTIAFVAAARPSLAPIASEDPLKTRLLKNQFFLAEGLFAAIARNNRLCRTLKSYEDAEVVLFWQEQASALGVDQLDLDFDAIPDLARFSVLKLLRENCLAVVLDVAQLVDPLEVGTPTDLTTFHKVQFVNQPNRDNAAFGVNLVPGGLSIVAPSGFTSSTGRYVSGVTATATGTVQVLVNACLVFPGKTTASDVCDVQTLARNALARLRIGIEPFPNGTVGVSYSDLLQASGGAGGYQWSVASGQLPPGLALNASTGRVSGSPTTAGTFSFRVRVTSGSQSDEADFVIVIIAAPPPPPGTCPDVRIDTNARLAENLELTCANNMSIGGFNNQLSNPVSLPSLTRVWESFAMRGEAPGGLSLPALESVGSSGGCGLLFELGKVAVLDLPALKNAFVCGLAVGRAPDLTTIKLGGLTLVEGELWITDNPKLTDISGIKCGARIQGNLTITGNPLLSTAAAQALAACLTVTGSVRISDNKP